MKRYVVVAVVLGACDRSPSVAPAVTQQPSTIAAVPSASAAPVATVVDAAAAASGSVTFDGETVGAPSASFEAIVGDWYVGEAGGARGLEVDGSKWRSGTPSVSLADQAKRLYGDRYAEFLDGVKTFAFFPLAVWKEQPKPGDMRISVRFHPLAGQVDQAAGIAFAIEPNGNYLGVRANALEDNLLFFRVEKGKRTVIDNVRAVSTPTKTWHTFVVELRAKNLTVQVDGQQRFAKALDAVPAGRVGLWSKAASQVLFDDFAVTSP